MLALHQCAPAESDAAARLVASVRATPKEATTPRYYACTTAAALLWGVQSHEPGRIDKGKSPPPGSNLPVGECGLPRGSEIRNWIHRTQQQPSEWQGNNGDRARTPVFAPISARPRGEFTRWVCT